MATLTSLMRRKDQDGRVTTIELFFDLVYVFAVTQLSHYLLTRTNAVGVSQAALLWTMVWVVWVYTTWVTNWLDPDRLPVRVMLVALMFGSLVLSAALPRSFEDRGLWVGAAYAVMQIGRSLFAVAGTTGDKLQRNFQRISAWCVISGGLALAGGLVHGGPRATLWIGAVVTDLLGGAVGFYTPGLGRSTTADWNISVDHMAERCQAFLLIALGESLVVIGSTVADLAHVSAQDGAAFLAAFAGVALLWWAYFDRSAEAGARVIGSSADPGRLGRSAYHFIHPIMVAGIIVTAAADERVLDHPGARGDTSSAWLILGGTALFLAGHAAFIATVWHTVPWSRLIAIGTLCLLCLLGGRAPIAELGGLTDLVVLILVVNDRRARQGSRELVPAASPQPPTAELST